MHNMSSSRQTESMNKRDYGFIIRSIIAKIVTLVHPYAKVVFPHFKSVHYFYIISMIIIGSILLYPVKNARYIDILFLSSGACTQAGLNTVNLNDITLYQQIVVYILAFFTTPIFIHGSLLFVRLYWFERYFDNIKESSKLNFKMRKTATIAAALHPSREAVDATRMNTYANQGIGLSGTNDASLAINNSEEVDDTDVTHSEKSSISDEKVSKSMPNLSVEHLTEPSDSEEGESRLSSPLNNPISSSPEIDNSRFNEGIRFGDLPHPSKIRNSQIEPSDMYRSIRMLQNSRGENQGINSADDDDVLIIKSPKEIEKDHENPIFTKKTKIHFDTPQKSSKLHRRRRRFSKNSQRWNRIRNSLAPSVSNSKSNPGLSSEEEADDDLSIDSENFSKNHITRNTTHENEDHEYDEESAIDDHSELEHIQIPDNHIEFVSSGNNQPLYNKIRHRIGNKSSSRAPFTSSSSLDYSTSTRVPSKSFSKLRSFASTASSNFFRSDEDDMPHLGRVMSTNYLSWVPKVGRNSTFIQLDDNQKEELGGVEYRAVKLLIKILIIYYIGFHILAAIMFLPYVLMRKGYINDLREQGVSPTWWGFFTSASCFNDLGLTLTNNSMSIFDKSIYIMLVSSFFIVIGNTGFPIMLRFVIWILFKFSRELSLYKESLGFLLDHPRRCFTLLFPSIPTWWLLLILVVLNGVDLILFVILDLGNSSLKSIPRGIRVVDGLFQAFSTRTAGFTVLNLAELHPAIQVSYMLMMYISVLPLAISIRRTNVYEEQSLGVYLKDENDNINEVNEGNPRSFIGAHLRNQLSFDLWFVFLGLFIICIAEGSKLSANNVNFSVFTVLFEIISAYGTVGLSLGYPGINESFSYEFNTISKLVIIAMMIRGRHRGLPYSIDRAIMFPSAAMEKSDSLQEKNAMKRSASTAEFNGDTFLKRALTRSRTGNSEFSRRPSVATTGGQNLQNASISSNTNV